MAQIEQSVARRISECARAVEIAKAHMEAQRDPQARLAAQRELDAREREMQDAAMAVNRGLSRPAPE